MSNEFEVLDRSFWRYALREGMQLEDVITECNRLADHPTFK